MICKQKQFGEYNSDRKRQQKKLDLLCAPSDDVEVEKNIMERKSAFWR